MRPSHLVSEFWNAPAWSPAGLCRRAGWIIVLYLLLRTIGLQEFTSVLNGTAGSLRLGWEISALLGVGFVLVHLMLVLLCPVLLLGAAFLATWNRIGPTSLHSPP